MHFFQTKIMLYFFILHILYWIMSGANLDNQTTIYINSILNKTNVELIADRNKFTTDIEKLQRWNFVLHLKPTATNKKKWRLFKRNSTFAK